MLLRIMALFTGGKYISDTDPVARQTGRFAAWLHRRDRVGAMADIAPAKRRPFGCMQRNVALGDAGLARGQPPYCRHAGFSERDVLFCLLQSEREGIHFGWG